MKRKIGFWAQIVTICLCICAIAVGVYSATTASITASGKIGFTAHGCKVEVGGNIYGHGVKDGTDHADGLPVPSTSAVPFATATLDGTVANGVSGNFDIGNRYFSDMESATGAPAPIVMTITVTNKSNYDVEVETNLNDVDKPAQVSIALTTGNATQIIAKDAVATFVFTLTLNPDSTGTTATYSTFALTDLIIPMTAVKYVAPVLHAVKITTSQNLMGEFERFYCLIDDSATEVVLELGENIVYVEKKIKLGFVLDMIAPGFMDITSTPNVYTKTDMMLDKTNFATEEIEISSEVEFIFKLYINF